MTETLAGGLSGAPQRIALFLMAASSMFGVALYPRLAAGAPRRRLVDLPLSVL